MSDGGVKVGCCGFPLTKGKYTGRFPVVEVQQTFYQPPRIATLQHWRAEAPSDFEFVLKAWQLITHWATSPTYKRIKAHLTETERAACGGFQPSEIVQEAWLTTRAAAVALAARRVLFQCPASFSPSPTNVANLRQFFSRLDRRELTLLWEPRGGWPENLVRSLCDELDLVHAVDPFVNRTVTQHGFYYRLHGGPHYQHRFAHAELNQLRSVLPTGQAGYVLFNNVSMLDDALRFQDLLQTCSGRGAEL